MNVSQEPLHTRSRLPTGDIVFALCALLITAIGVLGACGAKVDAAPEPEPAPVEANAAAPSNPLTSMQQSREEFAAVVAERVGAGSYTYLRLTTDDGDEHWLATMGRGVEPGARVVAHSYGRQHDFHSRRTGRTFATLLFGEVTPAT